MKQYRVVNRLTVGDYITASAFHLLKPAVQIAYIAFALLSTWYLAEFNGLEINGIVMAICMYLAMNLAFISIIYFLYKKNYAAIYKTLGYRYSDIGDEGLTEVYAESVSVVKWPNFKKIRELPAHFFLYGDKGNLVMLPKRLLPEGCAEFLRATEQKLNNESFGTTAASQQEPSPSDNDIIITGLSFKDHLTYQFYNAYVFRKSFVVVSSILLVFIVIITLAALVSGDVIYPVLFAAILVFMNLFLAGGAYFISKKEMKNTTTVIYRFLDDGFHMNHKFGKLFIRWDKLYAARDTGTHYFLYITKTHAAVLPKRLLDHAAMESIQYAIQKYGLKVQKNRS